MDKYIGIGFVILCLTILVGIIGILGYQLFVSKEKAIYFCLKSVIKTSKILLSGQQKGNK